MLRHLAIIMDGNGRWAKNRFKPRFFGHQEGAKTIHSITETCVKKGIKYLSLYAFSTENWNRPKKEIDFLMNLLEKYLHEQAQTYLDSNIIFKVIGDISVFSPKLQEKIHYLQSITAESCDGLTQILALNYGAKDELRRAFLKIQNKNLPITQESITQNLDTAGIPEVDMLIRTGGEQRLSNFLLWQSAYAELFFTKTLWPDFGSDELEAMIEKFATRQRRFGAI